jgi:long-chain acyl-CoA synthetase
MAHISATARTHPDKPAYIMANSGEVVSYKQLDERSNQGAQLFRSLGLKNGDHIAMMLENNRHFMEIVQAALRAGIVFTPISTHLREEETRYILGNCNARLFIGSKKLAAVAENILGDVPSVEHYYMVNSVSAGFESWEAAVTQQPTTPIADEYPGAGMLYSSGTTGQPKGVLAMNTATDIHEISPQLAGMAAVFNFTDETIYLSPAPLYHAAPLHYNNMNLAMGGTSIIMEKFDPEEALALIEKYQCSHSQWVPIMFVRMLKLDEERRKKFDTSSMQVAIHAAAPCPVEIKEQMIDWWGEVIFEYYSGSEGVGFTMVDSASWLTHRGSVGPALIGELHIVGDDGSELATGEVGNVYFSGGARFEYHDEPEKTKGAYNEQGWATLGDVGYLDEDGFLYLTDRKNFMIISGGVNIYPQEIENLLVTHARVADAAVFGIPNEEFGEEVKAVVQPLDWGEARDDLAHELIDWCKQRLSHIKAPRSVDFMEQLPRMENGKLYKRHLVDAYRSSDH